MKRSGKCPKCSQSDLFHSARIMDRGEGNMAMCLAIGRAGAIQGHDVGQFEVYVCKSCGFSELYVADAHRLHEIEERPCS